MTSSSSDALVAVGKVVGVHGIRGWLKVESFTEPRTNLFDYLPWTLQLRGQHLACSDVKGQQNGKGLLAKIAGCDDRDAALKWRGASIAVMRSQLPQLADDEFYWADLIGYQINTQDGVALGEIVQMHATGANDVMIVEERIKDGKNKQRWLPFLRGQVIKHIDRQKRFMTVDWDPDF